MNRIGKSLKHRPISHIITADNLSHIFTNEYIQKQDIEHVFIIFFTFSFSSYIVTRLFLPSRSSFDFCLPSLACNYNKSPLRHLNHPTSCYLDRPTKQNHGRMHGGKYVDQRHFLGAEVIAQLLLVRENHFCISHQFNTAQLCHLKAQIFHRYVCNFCRPIKICCIAHEATHHCNLTDDSHKYRPNVAIQ